MQDLNNSRQVPIFWAGRVRTGNKQAFEYVKDFEVSCRFNENFSRENIYKEIEKTKWPLSRVIGMVLRPGGLVDFTLRFKESAVNFAQQLKNLDSIKSATAYADSVVEVRIDFIPLGFPSDPISSYLHQNQGEIIGTPIRITDRFNIQTGTRVFKMTRKDWEENPIARYLFFGKYKFLVRYTGQKNHLSIALNKTTWKELHKKAKYDNNGSKSKIGKTHGKKPNEVETKPSNPPPTQEGAKQFFKEQPQRSNENEKRSQTNTSNQLH